MFSGHSLCRAIYFPIAPSREKVGQEYDLSASKVRRYIKIATLIEPLLVRVDAGEKTRKHFQSILCTGLDLCYT